MSQADELIISCRSDPRDKLTLRYEEVYSQWFVRTSIRPDNVQPASPANRKIETLIVLDEDELRQLFLWCATQLHRVGNPVR